MGLCSIVLLLPALIVLDGSPSAAAVRRVFLTRSQAGARQVLPFRAGVVPEALGDPCSQFDDAVNETNVTLNELEEQVSLGSRQIMSSFGALQQGAAGAGGGAVQAVANIGDKLVPLLADLEDTTSSVRGKVLKGIEKQIAGFDSLRVHVNSSFSKATEMVEALGDEPVSLLEVGQAFWPFTSKKKDAFEKAEDAVIAANKTVLKVSDAIDDVESTTIESMTELVLGSIENACGQFQEKCELVVAAQESLLPRELVAPAKGVCSTIQPAKSSVSSTVDTYVQLIGGKLAAAQESLKALFDVTDELMGEVQEARDAKEQVKDVSTMTWEDATNNSAGGA